LRLQVARQYPDLHLGPGYAWNSGNAGDNQWSLGLTLELPVLDQNQGPIAEAVARRKLAAAKFLERQAQVVGEIDRAVAGFRVAGEQWRTGKELLAAEQRQQQSIAAQRQAGADDSLDGLSAQLEWHSAQLAQLDNQAKLQAAYGALEDALQCPEDSLAAVIQKISTESPDPFSK
jgi:outer membrane protein TolC